MGCLDYTCRLEQREAKPTISACSTPNKNHMSDFWFFNNFSPLLDFPLSTPSSCYILPPTPYPGKEKRKKTWKLKDSKTHVVNHKTAHALCVLQPPPHPTLSSPPTTQSTDTHIDLEGEEKSYIRGDMETMGREEATSGNNLSCLRQGAKTKKFGGLVVGQWRQSERRWLQATIPARGPEQCLSCGLVEPRCALGEI